MSSTVSVSESSFVLTVVFDKISTLSRDVGCLVESERFMTQHGTSLYVKMCIGGHTVKEKDYCSLFLNSTDTVKLLYSMKLVNHIDDKKSINQTITSYDYDAGKFSGYGWPCVTESENLLKPKHAF